ncbi:helix-turn-helix transcriptional regulator [Plantactinospora sp. KBS50]|uniref:helix-turn-helix domain-containing protein n=1 Tax=Plantactinospora sp. KBS50 TaxID=2024580 RepID=UPI001E31BB68|nr:helix-turn-helix transcriptional regulator [Plantactinospora sp. KBS50]
MPTARLSLGDQNDQRCPRLVGLAPPNRSGDVPVGQRSDRHARGDWTEREVAELMGVTPGRVSRIENGDLEANEVATLSRYARALGARMRIIFGYGSDLRQIA